MNADFIAKLSKREKGILFVTVILLMILLSYYGVFCPVKDAFVNVDKDIFIMEQKLRKAEAFLREKDAILEKSESFANLERLEPKKDEEEIAGLLNFIEKASRETGVSLLDIQPQQVQADKLAKRYTIELTLESPMPSLTRFLYQLEYSDQILKIVRMEFSPKEEASAVLRVFLIVRRVVVR